MKTIKEDLKAQAKNIRALKDAINSGFKAGKYMGYEQGNLISAKRKFRYEHVAYCLLKGREYSQIENNPRPENEIDMDSVKKIMDSMWADIQKREAAREQSDA